MLRLKYKQYASGTGHWVTILHGLLGSAQNWHIIATELSARSQVLVPSLRNHGDSPHGPHSIELMQQDVLALLDSRRIQKTLLLGHSLGGLVAMSFALAHAERLSGLVVLDIAPGAKLNGMNSIFDAMKSVDLGSVTRKEEADQQLATRIANPVVRQFLLQNLRRQANGGYAWQCNLTELRRFAQEKKPFNLPTGKQYSGPALFMGGSRSEHKITGSQDMIRTHFPNSEIKMIPNAGHWVHFDAPAEFLNLVKEFIAGHGRGG